MTEQMRAAIGRTKVMHVGNWILLSLFVFVGVPGLEYAYAAYMRIYENLMPVEHYFEYRAVEPVQAAYKRCEDLTMISYVKRPAPTVMSYVDVLRCDSGDGFYLVDSDVWPASLSDPVDALDTGEPWTYQGKRPSTNSLCYFRSTVCAVLDYGIDKCEVIPSERFRLNGTQEDCG